MTSLLGLTAGPWKLATGGMTAALLIASGFLISAQIENSHLQKVNAELDARITDPHTGYLVTIATKSATEQSLLGQIEKQNAALKAQSEQAAAALLSATKTVEIAQRQTKQAEARVAVLLSQKPKGNTLEEKIMDVDSRLMETLK